MAKNYNGKFKVKFFGTPKFHINTKKGTVSCIMDAFLNTPYNPDILDYEMEIPPKNISGFGIAKCRKGDTFDVNRGMRIALARAENDCHIKAIRYLNEQRDTLRKLHDEIVEYVDNAYGYCAHNDDYIDSLVFESHPHYKKDVTTPKRGEIASRI